LTKAIEQELLERLKQGMYDQETHKEEDKQGIFNVPQQSFVNVASGIADSQGMTQLDPDLVLEEPEEKDPLKELVEELEEKDEDKEELVEKQFVADFEPDEDDLEDYAYTAEFGDSDRSSSSSSSSSSSGTKRKRPQREIEYEEEGLLRATELENGS